MKMMTKALLAATALVSLPSLAQAAPIITNVNIVVPNTLDGIYINLVTGVSGTSGSSVVGWDFNPYNNGAGLTFFSPASPNGGTVANGTTSGTSAALDLTAGTVIGAGNTYVSGQAVGTAFQIAGPHVVGFKFLNESTGVINYGYARITSSAGTAGSLGFPATITQLVYDNTGASLTVAAATAGVPEPATWAMMMMGFGAVGFAMRRRSNVTTRVRYA